ncbi:MAG: DUF2905 domain-containing protein [Deltaproteobacteria bacterium]
MSRILIVIGALLILAGLLWPFLLKSGLGRLPGDIMVRRGNFTAYFPIATSLVLSALISLILWLFSRR